MIRLIAAFVFVLAALSTPMQAETWNLRSDLSCAERDAVTDRLALETLLESDKQDGDPLAIGERLTLGWERPGFPEREPIFLMISFDAPVRLKGEGFYALLPDARAPFGISWARDTTRAVIPYYGRNMPQSRSIEVEPLLSGSLQVKWAVLGHNGCDEHLDTPMQGGLSVSIRTAGRPKIVVRDQVTGEVPRETLANRAGTRHLQLFDGRFRLLDAATGAEIMEGVGEAPHFSPAGRFVLNRGGNESGVFDSVDGAKLIALGSGELAWSHNDSFSMLYYRFADPAIMNGFVAGHRFSASTAWCRWCTSFGEHYHLDLENNALFSDNFGLVSAYRISDATEVLSFRKNEPEHLSEVERSKIIREIDRALAVADFSLDLGPLFSDDVALSSAFPIRGYVEEGSDKTKIPVPVDDLVVPPIHVPSQVYSSANIDGGVQRPDPKIHSSSPIGDSKMVGGLTRRLREFDIPVLSGEPLDGFQVGDDAPEIATSFDPSLSREEVERLIRDQKSSIEEYYAPFWRQIGSETGAFGFRMRDFLCFVNEGYVGEFDTLWTWKHNGSKYWLSTTACSAGTGQVPAPVTYLMSPHYPAGMSVDQPQLGGTEAGLNLEDAEMSGNSSCAQSVDACGFVPKLFGSTLVLYSKEALGYALVDLTTGKVTHKQFNLPRGDMLADVLMTEDRRHLVTVQEDGTFFINRIADTKTVLSGLYADDELIVWTDDGRYDATPEGAYFVSYTFPGHIGEYTAQQFEGYLRVPGLMSQVLDGSYTPAPVTITPPPVLSVEVDVDGAEVGISVHASAQVPLKTLSVFQDGLRSDVLPASGLMAEVSDTVDLLPGTRWLSLVATDENGVASAPYSVELTPASPRRVHVLSIGVDDFGDPSLDLGAAVSDARLFGSAVTGRAGDNIEIVSQTELLDSAATPDGILGSLDKTIAAAQPGDTLAIYFAGHGVTENGRFFLGASGLNVEDIGGSALAFDEVSERLRDADLRIALFLDACHSGLAGNGLFSTNDDAVESALEQIPSGIVIFAAAKGRELSIEDTKRGHGIFTQALSEVLSEPGYDLNGNGAVEIGELFRGTKPLVSERARQTQSALPEAGRATQTPWMARNLMVGDFALF